MRPLVLAALCIIPLSGCIAPEGDEKTADEGQSSAWGDDSIERFLHMADCRGTHTGQTYLAGRNPADPPAGWDRDDEGLTTIQLQVWRCGAVGLDGLERPATILWEAADNAIVPFECAFHGARPSYVLNLLTDDDAVASILNEKYALPARVTTFSVQEDTAATTWTWSVDGTTSWLRVASEGRNVADAIDAGRLVWPVGDGVGWLDFNRTFRQEFGSTRAAGGSFSPPHLLGIDGWFVGSAGIDEDGVLEGRIHIRGPGCS